MGNTCGSSSGFDIVETQQKATKPVKRKEESSPNSDQNDNTKSDQNDNTSVTNINEDTDSKDEQLPVVDEDADTDNNAQQTQVCTPQKEYSTPQKKPKPKKKKQQKKYFGRKPSGLR